MGVILDRGTEQRLERMFASADRATARKLLEEDCAEDVPGVGAGALDRIRIAAIKLSGGTIPGLLDAIVLAQTDYRDVLVAAGFEHDLEEHLRWWPGSDAS